LNLLGTEEVQLSRVLVRRKPKFKVDLSIGAAPGQKVSFRLPSLFFLDIANDFQRGLWKITPNEGFKTFEKNNFLHKWGQYWAIVVFKLNLPAKGRAYMARLAGTPPSRGGYELTRTHGGVLDNGRLF
jgi:hypothetical protein